MDGEVSRILIDEGEFDGRSEKEFSERMVTANNQCTHHMHTEITMSAIAKLFMTSINENALV